MLINGIYRMRFGLLVMVVMWGGVGMSLGAEEEKKSEESPERVYPKQVRVDEQSPEVNVRMWGVVEDFTTKLGVFESVFWDPRDTDSTRKLLRETAVVSEKKVMEIGTGSGLLSLCAIKAGATHVVATDVNKAAIANAKFNAKRLGFEDRLETRLVPLDDDSAFTVIGDDEMFDVIISNPPWVNQEPQTIDEYALYDLGFNLLYSLMRDLPQHLEKDGRLLLAYGCVDAINHIHKFAKEFGYVVRTFDDRKLEDLEEEFLPGMMLEVRFGPGGKNKSEEQEKEGEGKE